MVQKNHVYGEQKPWRERDKICMPSNFDDVVTHVNFCQDWSKGFSVARGRILAFSIDLLRRL